LQPRWFHRMDTTESAVNQSSRIVLFGSQTKKRQKEEMTI
jgi:hypothetical protein